MEKQYYADTVDENGEVYETVGENIRKGAKDPDSITGSFVETSDKVDFIDNLQLDAEHLKSSIVQALEGLAIAYGYTSTTALSEEQKQQIKEWLEIEALTQENIQSAITNIGNFLIFLKATVGDLRGSVYSLFVGGRPTFGGQNASAFTPEELQAIKSYLGITTPESE